MLQVISIKEMEKTLKAAYNLDWDMDDLDFYLTNKSISMNKPADISEAYRINFRNLQTMIQKAIEENLDVGLYYSRVEKRMIRR